MNLKWWQTDEERDYEELTLSQWLAYQLHRLKLRWAFRRSMPTEGTAALPDPQMQVDDGEEAFRRSHGYSRARVPLPQTDEQQAHNTAIDAEYQQEIEDRTEQMQAGTYKPRYYMSDELYDPATGGYATPTQEWLANPEHVNWHLEISMLPGRRANVTVAEERFTAQPLVSQDDVAEQRAKDRALKGFEAFERGERTVRTIRDLVGTRAQIVAACHGNEQMADQVEQAARKMFNVEDLDGPLPPPLPV